MSTTSRACMYKVHACMHVQSTNTDTTSAKSVVGRWFTRPGAPTTTATAAPTSPSTTATASSASLTRPTARTRNTQGKVSEKAQATVLQLKQVQPHTLPKDVHLHQHEPSFMHVSRSMPAAMPGAWPDATACLELLLT